MCKFGEDVTLPTGTTYDELPELQMSLIVLSRENYFHKQKQQTGSQQMLLELLSKYFLFCYKGVLVILNSVCFMHITLQ